MRTDRRLLPNFMQPADGDHYNCNHDKFSEFSN